MTNFKPQKAQIKLSALTSTDQPHSCNIDEAPQNNSSQNLTCKVKDWRDWTYTDGSLRKKEVGQDTGSGVYHPHLNIFHYVNSKGMGITNTISRAELAAIAAAIIHGYSYIATDNLTSLHQIKKQLSHPNLHCHHIQGDVLQSIAKAIRQSPSPIHFFKVSLYSSSCHRIAVGVLVMILCFLIMLPIVLSHSFWSGSQGVTGNAYAMLSMIAVFITRMACQGEAYEFLRPVSLCFKVYVILHVCWRVQLRLIISSTPR